MRRIATRDAATPTARFPRPRVRATASMTPAFVAALLVVGMLWSSRRGLEILDEGYLLRLVADPQATRPAGEAYLFGFLLHPLYELVGGDVALFRALGMLILVGASTLVSEASLRLVRHGGVPVSGTARATGALLAAAASMMVLSFNVMIPAYRTVTVVGLALVVAGFAAATSERRVASGALVGAGSWLCFVGKPTSAAALLVVLVVFAVGQRLVRWRTVLGAAVGAVVAAAVTLAVAQMTPADAAGYLSRGADRVAELGSHPSLWVVLGWGPQSVEAVVVLGPLLCLPVVAGAVLGRGRGGRERAWAVPGAVSALALVTVAVAWFGARAMGATSSGWMVLSLGWLVPLGCLGVELADRQRGGRPLPAPVRANVLLLLVMPYVSAVGTNLPFSVAVPLATVFWVVALVVLTNARPTVTPSALRTLMPALVASVVAVALWVVHSNGPWGGELSRNVERASVAGGALLLNPQDAHIATLLRETAARNGVTSETPVLDLSGMGAGYAYFTGGRTLGRAHHYAYLPQSVTAAERAVATEACPLRAAAWLLYSPGIGIADAWTRSGIDLDRDYTVVTQFSFTRDGRAYQMRLLRPEDSVAHRLGCAPPTDSGS